MRPYIHPDFLLPTEAARRLYHGFAAQEPIFDFHCHLSPQEIREDARFETITQVWLGGDHYKWRLMRANGVPEELITGDGDPYEKFLAWARTVEKSVGQPPVRLDPHGAEKLLRRGGTPQRKERPRHLGGLQRQIAGGELLGPGAHLPEQREGPVHHRRSGGHPGAPRRPGR